MILLHTFIAKRNSFNDRSSLPSVNYIPSTQLARCSFLFLFPFNDSSYVKGSIIIFIFCWYRYAHTGNEKCSFFASEEIFLSKNYVFMWRWVLFIVYMGFGRVPYLGLICIVCVDFLVYRVLFLEGQKIQ